MENFDTCFLKDLRAEIRTTRGCSDKLDSLLDNKIDHVRPFNKCERHIHTKGPIDVELEVLSDVSLNKSAGYITVLSHGSTIIVVLDHLQNDEIELEFEWLNSWQAPKTHASIEVEL